MEVCMAKNPSERIEDFYKEDFNTDSFDNIRVPGHIELQGYGKPQYVNTMYPWEGRETLFPPYISEKDNPIGSYVRYFDLEDGLKGKDIYISFQGAGNSNLCMAQRQLYRVQRGFIYAFRIQSYRLY